MTLKELRQKRQGRHGAENRRRRSRRGYAAWAHNRARRHPLRARCFGSCCGCDVQWVRVPGRPLDLPSWGRP